MARIPEDELEKLKREVDLASLVRSKNIELKPHGSKDLLGQCPFHQDDKPSFVVTPSKNLFHCMGCGEGGSVIDFVMKHDGVSFRHAAELLREQNPALFGGSTLTKTTIPKLECPLSTEADEQTLFRQVLDYYHERLKQSPAALDYLRSRGIVGEDVLKVFNIGLSDRTLGLRLPMKNRKEGAALRENLTKIGIYRESGHEHFNGCIVFPIADANGLVTEIYGRRFGKQKSKVYHLYLPGPHSGLLNPACFASPEIILTESVIDALTFWCNGLRHVTCIYGTEGFNDEHLEAFKKHNTQKVYFAYDNDDAGKRAVERDASRLGSLGIDCYRIKFPAGMDANEYALKVTPATKSLAVLLQSAEWLGKGKVSSQAVPSPVINSTSTLAANVSSLNASATKGKKQQLEILQQGEDYLIAVGDREYRIRGLQKNTSFDVLKINLRVMHDERFYLDVVDLYRSKDRNHFIVSASNETELGQDLLKRDIGKVLLALEELQEKRIKDELEPKAPEITLDEIERQEALEFLKTSKLTDRILSDFDKCGIVGEGNNLLTGYLGGVSRKLDKPLAIIIQSTSAAGKSSLMEAVLSMMPEEEKIKYSAMTGQSLYYLGETNLKNKILAIVEEEGAEKASYALKLLQSEGELTIASTGKDEQGRMKTEEYHVEGPVMIFLTTTAVDIDEELLNRCLVLSVDESREQTKAIHRLQREARTLEGLNRKLERDKILKTHRNAQRLLKPISVVNPFAPKLTFLDDRTRTRRDHEKYLTLIDTIALLHQYQRPLKENGSQKYIEVTLDDIAAANKLAHEVLGRSLDELPPQTRRLLDLLVKLVEGLCKKLNVESDQCLFSRRQVRAFTGWSNTQLKVHLDRLEEFEYIVSRRGMRGSAYEYELLFDGNIESEKPQLVGLIDIDKLKYDAKFTGAEEKFTAPKRGQNGGVTDRSINGKACKNRSSEQVAPVNGKNAQVAEKELVIVT